jgi:hypothetical protein
VRTGALSGFRFGAVQTVSDPAIDSILADLDAGPSGELAIGFARGSRAPTRAPAPAGCGRPCARPARTRSAPPRRSSRCDTPVEATLRFDPASGRAVAAWRSLRANAIATAAREPLVVPAEARRF